LGPTACGRGVPESNFTWLVTSVSEDDGSPFGGGSTTAIRRIGPFTIGFFSVLATDTATRSNPGSQVHFTAPIVAANEAVEALRAHGVDVVGALTHEPVDDDKALVDEVPGIDLVLGGDEHVPMTVDERGTPIIKAGHDAEFLAVVDLTLEKVDGKTKVTVASHLVPTLGAKPSAALMAKIKGYNDDFASQLAAPIATLDTELDSRSSVVRSPESGSRRRGRRRRPGCRYRALNCGRHPCRSSLPRRRRTGPQGYPARAALRQPGGGDRADGPADQGRARKRRVEGPGKCRAFP